MADVKMLKNGFIVIFIVSILVLLKDIFVVKPQKNQDIIFETGTTLENMHNSSRTFKNESLIKEHSNAGKILNETNMDLPPTKKADETIIMGDLQEFLTKNSIFGLMYPETFEHVQFGAIIHLNIPNYATNLKFDILTIFEQTLQHNNVTFIRLGDTGNISDMDSILNKRNTPVLFSMDNPYINFFKAGYSTQPIYIAFLMDPYERLLSFYTQEMQPDNITNIYTQLKDCIEDSDCKKTLYARGFQHYAHWFCGSDSPCNTNCFYSAKGACNVARYFGFVGAMEAFDSALLMLSELLNRYFNNIKRIYQENIDVNQDETEKQTTKPIKKYVYEVVLNFLKPDYEIYNFVYDRNSKCLHALERL
ncbi:unnamed protein product [Owenia fusiformis]|uniref:Uncharacterized protein n=1 Tax=Owenia fusiformis TaxID=6347 RepID=A0A8J1XPE8_OWEFU|nr:unnamed protein product [Owenia fusiformis]